MTAIRPMRPDDAAAVAGLTTQLGYPVGADAQRRRVERVLASPDDHLLVVAIDEADHPIGWAHVERMRMLEHDDRAQLMGLVVADGHRSRGIGAELLAHVEAWARDRGCVTLTVRSRVNRERAHRFYAERGYTLGKTSHVFVKGLG